MSTLLAFLAHPDDESFGIGGTLAHYARAGVSVHYLCATRGESGTVDAHRLEGYASVEDLRDTELACASKALGLASYAYLGFRDSGMKGSPDNARADAFVQADIDVAARRLAGFVVAHRPNVLITHDQYGGYGHPDHIQCHRATLRLYELAWGIRIGYAPDGASTVSIGAPLDPALADGMPAPRLFYSVFPKRFVRWGARALRWTGKDPRRWGRNHDIDLVQIASWDLPPHVRIDIRPVIEVKRAASACHASQQMPTKGQPLIQRLFFRRSADERFSQAYPAAPARGRLKTDLFAE
ncbi:MAG: PIG-L family deacetylase [Thermoflexales bacterium]|nr:PIG-L family deacetylase [Thermoflexales bacterium]